MQRIDKVVAYIVHDGQLLAFIHPDDPDLTHSGVQVPAGTVEPGESPDHAVLREAFEETALDGLRVERYLGVGVYDARPHADAIHVRHHYHLSIGADEVPQRWFVEEQSPDGPVRFELFWLPLSRAHVVSAGQAAFVGRLTGSWGGGVELRAVVPADVEVFFEHERDPEARRRANFPARDHEMFTAHWRRRILGDDSVRARTITVDGAPAGNVVAWWQAGQRQVGYWLGREFWGRGIGTRAVALFLEEERTRPLYADADVADTASIRLLQRCGFRRIETVRDGDAEYVVLVLD